MTSTVQAVKDAGARETRYRLWDTLAKGFGPRVNGDGAKSCLLSCAFEGDQRRHTIGERGSPRTPEAARDEALRMSAHARSGTDPEKAARERKAAGTTVTELCDLYVTAARAGQVLTEFDGPRMSSTPDTDEGRIRHPIKPLLGTTRVRGPQPRDVDTLPHAAAAGAARPHAPSGSSGVKQTPRAGPPARTLSRHRSTPVATPSLRS